MSSLLTRSKTFSRWLAVGIGVGMFGMATMAVAQTFVEPSGAAPGGRSATFLDTSDTLQKKLGSLMIGDQQPAPGDKLCLNAANSSSPECIRSWNDVSISGGPFVATHALQSVAGDPTLAASYNSYFQTGYAHIRGDAAGASDSVIVTENLTIPNTTAIYGTDNLDPSNYAGYFSGKLAVVNHYKLNPGNPDIPGRICLNDTADYNPTGSLPRTGCIDSWTDIGAIPLVPYVQLQAANPPNIQIGAARISKAWQIGAVVVGSVSTGFNNNFCGDGLCSGASVTPAETVASCPADCNGFSGLGSGASIEPCQESGQCDSGTLIPPEL